MSDEVTFIILMVCWAVILISVIVTVVCEIRTSRNLKEIERLRKQRQL